MPRWTNKRPPADRLDPLRVRLLLGASLRRFAAAHRPPGDWSPAQWRGIFLRLDFVEAALVLLTTYWGMTEAQARDYLDCDITRARTNQIKKRGLAKLDAAIRGGL